MKQYICTVLGIVITYAGFVTSVHAGFQSHVTCAFYLEHESGNKSQPVNNSTTPVITNPPVNNASTPPAGVNPSVIVPDPNTTGTSQPVSNTTPGTAINPNFECPDPGYSGGSIALAVFWGIFIGFVLGVGTTVGVSYAVLKKNFPEIFELDSLNESQLGEYGDFELEPAYYPEADAPGFRFKFKF